MASSSSVGMSLIISFVMLPALFCFCEAKDFLVGGKTGSWKVPSSADVSLNKWAEANRFQVGDSLVWKIEDEKDSVLLVSKDDYQTCNTSSPIESHKGTEVKVKLTRSGPFYFVSGIQENCKKGEKLIVVVMSSGRRGFFGASPAPSPAEAEGPAVARTSGASPAAVKKGGLVSALFVLAAVIF